MEVGEFPAVPAAHLSHLDAQHASGGLTVGPPLSGIRPEPLEPGLAGDAMAHRLVVTVAEGFEEPRHDVPDLVRRFHRKECHRSGVGPQPPPT